MSRERFAKHFAGEPRIAKRADEIAFPGSGCWLWPASSHYPQYWNGERRELVHRVSLEIKIGRPLGKLQARHKCDTPLCVNPGHLEPGTHRDNARDMVERGRGRPNPMPRGIRNPKATVPDAEVREALALLAAGASLSEVGRMYGVTHTTVAHWRDGKFRADAAATP